MPDVRIIRGYVPGAIGRVAEMHAAYYHREWGFDLFFEARVATELAEFLGRYDEERDGLWTAQVDGSIEGAIAIDGAHAEDRGAHLRWFIVSDALRGQGAGSRLMESAIGFCRSRGYRRVYLNTFEGLHAARRLYEKHGFRLVEERLGSQWGREVNEQRFELLLEVEIDWDRVKKQTLWSYEDLIEKLRSVLAYDFVQEHYNHTMVQARGYAAKIRRGYLQDRGDMTAYVDSMAAQLGGLESRRVGTYSDLVHRVATREQCVAFLRQTDFDFDPLIETLNYLLRWVLPFKTPLREFMDVESDVESGYLETLKKQKIGSNTDLLEAGRTEAGRARLASTTGIPSASLLALVHRADISRLAYVRGKTVKHLCGGGYDTLEKIANADPTEMEERMDAYYGTLGKSLADFKAVIPLSWMIGGARILPRVVEPT